MSEIKTIIEAKNHNIIEMLEKIKHNLYDPDSKKNNWCHVGTTTKVEDDLKEIISFMGV